MPLKEVLHIVLRQVVLKYFLGSDQWPSWVYANYQRYIKYALYVCIMCVCVCVCVCVCIYVYIYIYIYIYICVCVCVCVCMCVYVYACVYARTLAHVDAQRTVRHILLQLELL